MPTGDPPLTLRDLREIDLARLKGVGAALEARLADMELHNVLDLLQRYPRRWIDRTKRVCGVFLSQVFPFYDHVAIDLLGKFETEVYRAL